MRADVVSFCIEKVFPLVQSDRWPGKGSMLDAVEMVEEWLDGRSPDGLAPTVENGFLFLRGEPVGRIVMTDNCGRRAPFSEEAYYWEGRILERQGT